MTEQELANSLQNPDFAIKFMVDNNPDGVIANLKENLGYTVNTKAEAVSVLHSIIATKDAQKIKDAFNVQYLNNAINGTGGFRNYFMRNSGAPPAEMVGRINWDGVFSFLGGGFSNLSGGGMGTSPGIPKTPEQIAAEKKAQEEADLEKKKAEQRGQIILVAVFGFLIIAIIVTVVLITKPSKAKQAA